MKLINYQSLTALAATRQNGLCWRALNLELSAYLLKRQKDKDFSALGQIEKRTDHEHKIRQVDSEDGRGASND